MTILLQRMSEDEEATTGSGFGAVESEFGNLPLRQLSYHAAMLGLAVRTTILQTYYNPFDEAIEAIYIFPLEYGHAVIACEMRIGERVVRAELKERAEARREYAEALRDGHRAALLEENRPETFSMSVGNIPPGEAIQICIQTVSQLSVVRGEWTLRLPLVVAPRYTSGIPLPRSAFGSGTSWDTNQVPDASTVTPPTWLPGFANPIDLRLVVELDLGHIPCSPNWAHQLKSSLHTALIDTHLGDADTDASKRCRVQLLPGERVNRDFILRGRVLDTQTSSSVVCETNEIVMAEGAGTAPHTTFAVTIVPPSVTSVEPRQVMFLLDRSGSMEGWKIAAARRGLWRLLDRLNDRDSFQLAAFEIRLDVFQPKVQRGAWIACTDANRFEAVRWLSNIEARGGTEMGQALGCALRAFSQDSQPVKVHNGAIVLVTDGQVTGEDELLRLIGTLPRDRVPRLFCLGVDRAVNASVLERIWRRTGGTFELVESEQRLDEVLGRFADEIANPAVTQLRLTSQPGQLFDIAQPAMNTLYSGRSQTFYGRYAGTSPITLNVHGVTSSSTPYHEQLIVPAKVTVPEAKVAQPGLLHALWGKERLRHLEDDLFASGERDSKLKQQIVNCSLECGVLSRLTAFVAVDRSEKVTDGRRPHSILNHSELPEGWVVPCSRMDATLLVPVPRAGAKSSHMPFPALQAIAEQAAKKMLDVGAISHEQLTEAQKHAAKRGLDVCGALVDLQYATQKSVAEGIAAATQTTFIPVSQLRIDESILRLIPASVARENHVLPIADGANALTVVMSNPHDFETIEKLRFILNRDVTAFCGAHDEIANAIDHHYGQIEGESADSILQEFTDTQIDFTSSEKVVYDTRLPPGAPLGITFGRSNESQDSGVWHWLRKMMHSRGISASSSSPVSRRPLGTAGSLDDEVWEDGFDASTTKPTHRLTPEWIPSYEDSAPIVQLVSLLIAEAVQSHASHVIVRMDNTNVIFEFVIEGKLVPHDRVGARLWRPILNRVKGLANLDNVVDVGVQTGGLKMTVGVRELDLVVHAARDSFMIELPAAKLLPTIPEAIEQWWAAVGATAQP